jgi:hypothetical protein
MRRPRTTAWELGLPTLSRRAGRFAPHAASPGSRAAATRGCPNGRLESFIIQLARMISAKQLQLQLM